MKIKYLFNRYLMLEILKVFIERKKEKKLTNNY